MGSRPHTLERILSAPEMRREALSFSRVSLLLISLIWLGACSEPKDIPRTKSPAAIVQPSVGDENPAEEAINSEYEEKRRIHEAASQARDDIQSRLDEAETREEKVAARQALEDWRNSQPEYAWGENPVRERVSWDEVKNWWPYRPLLRATWLPKPDGRESLFASTSSGGRSGDPRSELASVDVLYDYAPHFAESSSYSEILDAGGILIGVTYIPPDHPEGQPGYFPDEETRVMTMRGHDVIVVERKPPKYNVSWRHVIWRQPTTSGGLLHWEIRNHPDRYTVNETIQFGNEAAEET